MNGIGMGFGMWVFWFMFLLFVILLLLMLSDSSSKGDDESVQSPMKILEKRLARGEISKDEFEEMKKELE